MSIPLEVMRLGQDCLDRMEDHPDEADELIAHMHRAFEQFKAGVGDKSIEGSYRPTNQGREITMKTITMTDSSGTAIKFDEVSFIESLKNTNQSDLVEILNKANVPFGPLGLNTPPSTAFNPVVNEELNRLRADKAALEAQVRNSGKTPAKGEEAPLLTKAEEREAEREADRYSRIMFNAKRKLKEIAWTLVEYLGKAMIIVGAIVGGVMLAKWVFPVPEGMHIGGMPAAV